MNASGKKTVMLDFTSLQGKPPGTVSGMLKKSYAEIIDTDPSLWAPEVSGWEEYDREIFRYPDTVGNSIFLSWADNALVGFGSFDPRPAPQFGIIGHHCILPEFRSSGFGRQQLLEILRRLQALKIKNAVVTTMDHPFFEPARRLYESLGFRMTGTKSWRSDAASQIIEFETHIPRALKRTANPSLSGQASIHLRSASGAKARPYRAAQNRSCKADLTEIPGTTLRMVSSPAADFSRR